MRPKKSIELATGDRISWRSGSNVFCGVVQAAFPPKTTNEAIRQALDPNLPEYLVNLGRENLEEIRVVISVTHKQIGKSWKAYEKARVKAVKGPTLSSQILLYRKPKQRKDKEPKGAPIVWVVPKSKSTINVGKGNQNDPLDFSDFDTITENDIFIAGLD
jgi:hypothetical protein